MGAYVTLGFALAMLALGVSLYNRLVTLHKRYRNAFTQIDVQLKQRYNLIPNLVEVARLVPPARARRAVTSPNRVGHQPRRCCMARFHGPPSS